MRLIQKPFDWSNLDTVRAKAQANANSIGRSIKIVQTGNGFTIVDACQYDGRYVECVGPSHEHRMAA